MQKSPQVLIVGAGPSGLVLAIWLRKKGVSVRIVDKTSTPGTTSRALAVQARTLEFYRQLGIADELVKAGTLAPELRLRRLGRVVAIARFGAIGKGMSPFAYLLFCSQDVHEKILCKVLRDLGTEVERETELVGFTQDQNGVRASLKTKAGVEEVSAQYLCGCDGAHSAVRHGLGILFPGGTYSQVFFVADVQCTGDMASGGVQISVSPKDFCIVMPIQTQGTVRLTGLVPPENEKKEKVDYSDVAESVTRNMGLKIDRVNWFSSYHVHHRVADNFHKGRVFLSGDAGHIHSPAGGQGMNTGIGDAINLAWKIADVLGGRTSPKLLDSYEEERIAFARTLVATTDTVFKFIASRSIVGSLFRAFLLPWFFAFVTRFKPVVRFLFRTISQIRIKYRKSAVSEGALGEVHAGDRLPWVKFERFDNFEPLKSLEWQAHVYGDVVDGFESAMKTLGLKVHRFDWNEDVKKTGLHKNALYFIRPDGYIGLASKVQDAETVRGYLAGL